MYCCVEFGLWAPRAGGRAGAEEEVVCAESGLSGCFVSESGYRGDDSVRTSSWLVAEDLPHSQRVDRVLCCEFQALTALCSRLEEHAAVESEVEAEDPGTAAALRAEVGGAVRLLTTGVSCASCIGAMRQFQQLFPGVALSVEMKDWWPHVHGVAPG